MSRISKTAQGIAPSMIRKLFNIAKTMDNVIDFTLGDPDVQPHINIKKAACEAINTGKTRYSQNAGLLELRQAISAKNKKEENLDYMPETEIAVTVGAMEGLYLTLLALIDKEDEVIIPAPYYVNYKQMVEMCGGKPVIVSPSDTNSLLISSSDIEAALTDKTKIIILNTPANPSGKIIPKHTLQDIANMVIRQNITVITDEVYKKLNYETTPYISIATFPKMKQHAVVVNSLSKEFCMTGYRVGYILGPEDIVSTVVKLQENVAACAPLPSQYAAIEALRTDINYSSEMIEIFTHRRNTLCSILGKIDGIKVHTPEATFYAMIDIRGLGYDSSEKFAYDLLEKAHVAVVPGIAYGDICEGHIRIAFTLEEEKIIAGANRIANFAKSLKE